MGANTTGLLFFTLLLVSGFNGTSSCNFSSASATTGEATANSSQNTPDLAHRIQRIENGLLLPVIVRGQPAVPMPIAERMRFFHTPGVSIAVINNNRIEWARGYGVRESGNSEPVTTETLFQAGSISKAVTALAALRLVQQGKLNLDEDVNRKFVSWKIPENEFTREQKVTVRRILSHTAGLTNNSVGEYAFGTQLPTLLQSLDGAKPANSPPIRVDYVPGSRFRYSGGGYTVLQQLLTDVERKAFPVLMRELVMAPLGMKRSTFQQPLPDDLRASAAVGHGLNGEKIAGNWRVYPETAAAGMWSTPIELAHLLIEVQQAKAGRSDKILTPATVKQMLTPQTGGWGLGFVVAGEGRSARFSHGGDTQGFNSVMVAYSDAGQGAVIMTNSVRGNALLNEILRSIAREYGWSDYQPVERIVSKINRNVYDAYIGQYQLEISPDYAVAISVAAGKLMMEIIQPVGRIKAELLPESETRFFRTDVDVQVTFVKGERGQVNGLIVHQQGAEYRAKRIE